MKRIFSIRLFKPAYVYIYIALLSLLIFLITSILGKGEILRLMSFGNQIESDYYRQIVYASDINNIYYNTGDAPFPPFAYLFYHLLYLIDPFQAPIELNSFIIAKQHGMNSVIYVALMSIKIALLYKAIECHLKDKYETSIIYIFSTLVILSLPFLFGAIDRGNVIILVDCLLLFALYLKESENKIAKEIAMILIAISAAIKVYPAIVGLFYIKEKRYKEAIRLIIYGMAFFFIPFIFTGGFNGIKQYVNVLLSIKNSVIPRWTSIAPMILAICDALKINVSSNVLINVITVATSLYALINIISFFKGSNSIASLVMLFSLMSACVPDSYRYTAIYMLIPFIYLIKEENKRTIYYLYMLLFCMIFSIPVLAYFIDVSVVDLFIYSPIYLLSIISYYDIWILQDS